MRRHEGVHEGLEVGSPPLCQAVAHLPVASLLALAQPADGGQSLVQPGLEALYLLVLWSQIITRKSESNKQMY